MSLSYTNTDATQASLGLVATGVGYGYSNRHNESQTKHAKVYHSGWGLVQDDLAVKGIFRSEDEQAFAAEWLKKWFDYATNAPSPKFLRLRVVPPKGADLSFISTAELGVDYLVMPKTSFEAGRERFVLAPEWQMQFFVVKDYNKKVTFALSQAATANQWWTAAKRMVNNGLVPLYR